MNTGLRYLVIFAATATCAHGAPAAPAGIPEALRPPSDQEPAFALAAQGVQIYACKPRTNDPGAYQWAFVAPEATLTENGATVGRHFAGPTWEWGGDRSSVKGAVLQRHDGGAGNIPWLLLAATPQGEGKFAGVTSIQRVATKGGVEPAEACDASKAGQEVRVPYTADYYFYKRR
jgi:hypothetical protein